MEIYLGNVQNLLPHAGPQEWVASLDLATCSHCHLLDIVHISASLDSCPSGDPPWSHMVTSFLYFKIWYSTRILISNQKLFSAWYQRKAGRTPCMRWWWLRRLCEGTKQGRKETGQVSWWLGKLPPPKFQLCHFQNSQAFATTILKTKPPQIPFKYSEVHSPLYVSFLISTACAPNSRAGFQLENIVPLFYEPTGSSLSF